MKELNELNERIDGVDEIINNLAKKATELDKRQIKYEEQNETVKALIPKVKALEVKASSYPEVYIPDYSKEFKQIFNQIKIYNDKREKESSSGSTSRIEEKLMAIQKALSTISFTNMTPKMGWIFTVYFILILFVALLTGTTIGYAFESHELCEEIQVYRNINKDTINQTSSKTWLKKKSQKAKQRLPRHTPPVIAN